MKAVVFLSGAGLDGSALSSWVLTIRLGSHYPAVWHYGVTIAWALGFVLVRLGDCEHMKACSPTCLSCRIADCLKATGKIPSILKLVDDCATFSLIVE